MRHLHRLDGLTWEEQTLARIAYARQQRDRALQRLRTAEEELRRYQEDEALVRRGIMGAGGEGHELGAETRDGDKRHDEG